VREPGKRPSVHVEPAAAAGRADGGGRSWRRGLDREPVRLVDHEHVGVLVQDRQLRLPRVDRSRDRRREIELDRLASEELAEGRTGLSPDADVAVRDEEPGPLRGGRQRTREEAIEPLAGELPGDMQGPRAGRDGWLARH
jgi:hypothetical protein